MIEYIWSRGKKWRKKNSFWVRKDAAGQFKTEDFEKYKVFFFFFYLLHNPYWRDNLYQLLIKDKVYLQHNIV